jgi:hypothetical protein
MPQGWRAGELARVTAGRWKMAPLATEWRCDSVCAEPSRFRNAQMLLAPAGAAGLPTLETAGAA